MMLGKAERLRLKKLLSEAVPLLCRNSIGALVESKFCVEAMIGITMDERQVAIICFKEMMGNDGGKMSLTYGEEETIEEDDETETGDNNEGESSQRNDGQYGGASERAADEYDNDECMIVGQRGGAKKAQTVKGIKREWGDEGMESNGWETMNSQGGQGSSGSTNRSLYNQSGNHNSTSMVRKQKMVKSAWTAGDQYQVKQEGFDGGMMEACDQFVKQEDYEGEEDWEGNEGEECDEAQYEENDTAYEGYEDSPRQRSRVNTPRKWSGAGRGRGRRVGVPQRRQASLATNMANFMSPMADGQSEGSQKDILKGLCRTMAEQAQVEQQFVCHICNAKLANKASLVTHIKGSHIAASLFQCEHCNESFKWYMQLYRHKKRNHPNEGGETGDADLNYGEYSEEY